MGARRILYAKCEMYNMTGSIKDRMALHILEEAHASGSLKPGDLINEASSGGLRDNADSACRWHMLVWSSC